MVPGRGAARGWYPQASPALSSLGVLDAADLADHGDLDLPRVLELLLDPLGHVAGEDLGGDVVDVLGLDHDPDLAAGLHGEHLVDPGVAAGDLLEALQALDVGLEGLAAGPWPAAGDGVGGLGEHGLDGALLDLAVVGLDGVDDLGPLLEPAGQLGPDDGVRPLDLVGEGLADVVQEPAALGQGHVHAELGGHDPGQVGGLDQVAEHVLAVGGPVLEPAQDADQLGVQVGDADLQAGVLAGPADLALDLLAGSVVGLLDAGRVDAAVGDQLLQGEAADLAPDRVEAGQQDRFGGVVDDQVDAGDGLEGADVATLAADDAALHVVGGQRQDRDGGLGGLLGGDPLDGQGDDLARAAVGLLPRLLLEVADQPHGVPLGVLLDLLDEHGLGLGGGHGRDLLEAAAVLLGSGLELGPGRLERLLAVVQADLAPVEQGRLGLQALLLAGQALLALLDLGQPGPGLDLDLSSKLGRFDLDTLAQSKGLVAGLHGGLAAGGLGLPAGVVQQRLGLVLGRPEDRCRLFTLVGRSNEEAEQGPGEHSDDENDGLHGGLLCNPHPAGCPAGESRPAELPRPSGPETATAPSGARRCRDPAITVRRSDPTERSGGDVETPLFSPSRK